jgi:hypothetical protein
MATSGTSVPCVAGEGFGDCLTLRAWSFGSPDLVAERVGVNESSSDNDLVQQGLQSLVSSTSIFFYTRNYLVYSSYPPLLETQLKMQRMYPHLSITQQQVGVHLHSLVEG